MFKLILKPKSCVTAVGDLFSTFYSVVEQKKENAPDTFRS